MEHKPVIQIIQSLAVHHKKNMKDDTKNIIINVALLVLVSFGIFLAGNNLTQNKDSLELYIKESILNGVVPTFDVSKVSLDDINKAYIKVAESLGDDFKDVSTKNGELNLYNRIRTKAKANGLEVKNSENQWSERKIMSENTQ